MFKLREVFGIHLPPVTQIDRSDTAGYKDFADSISQPGWLLRLYGPSKSGKTVLCRQVMDGEGLNAMFLHGLDLDTINRWWLNLAVQAGEGVDIVGDTVTARDEIKILEYCRRTKRPIIIDDFHRINKKTRDAIIRRAKGLLDYGVTVIVISVADIVEDILEDDDQARNDFQHRTKSIQAPLWQVTELEEIAYRGFKALKVNVKKSVITTIAYNAYRNPLLMQQYCLQICLSYSIRSTQKDATDLEIDGEDLQTVFVEVAKRDASRFHKLWADSTTKQFKLQNGNNANLRALILLAISRVSLNSPIKMSTITRRIPYFLSPEEEPPSRNDVTNTVSDLVDTAQKTLGKDLSIDILKGAIYVLHPFFKVYLLWCMVPKLTGTYPDLQRYIDEEEFE